MTGSPTLLVVAHGSRDARHPATVHALVREVSAQRPGLRVEVAFLDFNVPSVPAVLEALAADGAGEVVALPLLLTRAFHAKSDIPSVLRRAPRSLRIHQAQVLGPSPLLIGALERRLSEAFRGTAPGSPAETPERRRTMAGLKRSTGVVLASAGSTDPEAIAAIADVARELRRTGWCAVRPAFASASLPRTEDAVRALRADGVRRVAVAPYVIAPGRLPDRIAAGAAEADLLAPVLGPAPELARLLLTRYDEAGAVRRPLAVAG
ncbi:sirohydrochlorin chelatase [Streptomyces sp. MUM 203J]|uniref:sirohydrochlorin chelatase n=1 Tax=Streptomyces sp. MUM 203J TaxID=2791990 RepID=UPI001F04EAC7|nr:sirohydrochlorin chelatase [Streptomyces sp. MUM 203J]MCH0541522.1 sirohydrochlorin chelatase [Streptomyces sp. MUM 203J]